MNWIEGCERNQPFMLPPCIEDYVCPENPVRLLDVFVDQLELRTLGFVFPKQNNQDRGRPAYQPRHLLKLYLYGYLHRIRSSRRLEQECARNLELIWLLDNLKPDFKTIADFRKDNAEAFKEALKQFNKTCRELELFGGQLLAIDGTKIKGQNSPSKNWSQTKLNKQQQRLDERLEEYLKALDQADQQEPPNAGRLSTAQLQQKIQQLKDRKQQIEQKLQTMEKLGQTQLSATDPESRSMKGAKGHVVGYNLQAAVDAKHHLLVSTSLTNSCVDQGQLAAVAQAAKQELQLQSADLVADGGYFVAEDIKSCQDMGLEVHLPEVKYSPSERAGFFGKADFKYDQAKDTYYCPSGAELKKRRQYLDEGKLRFHYDNPQACARCPIKSRCTASEFRTMSRWEHEESLERLRAKVRANPEKLQRRKTLIEHCWGTLKWLLPEGFLLKGLKKAAAEVSLAHFAYNFKRALKVVGLVKLLQALKKPQGPSGPGPEQPVGPMGSLVHSLPLLFCVSKVGLFAPVGFPMGKTAESSREYF